jgi:hypothetical protein
MRFCELEIIFNTGNLYHNVNVMVPNEFHEWTEDGQLKYLFNLRYLIDHNKKTIYNASSIERIKIVEDV